MTAFCGIALRRRLHGAIYQKTVILKRTNSLVAEHPFVSVSRADRCAAICGDDDNLCVCSSHYPQEGIQVLLVNT
jgi:hypothetical protein